MQGLQYGTDDMSRIIYALAALSIDVGGVAVPAAIAGSLARRGHKWAAAKAMASVYICGAISIGLFYQFNAVHRVLPSKIASEKHAAELTATTQASAMSNAIRDRQLNFLETEAHKAAEAARAKGPAAADARSAAADQLRYFDERMKAAQNVEVKPAPIEVDTDAGATSLAEDIGLSKERVQKLWGLVIASAVLLVAAQCIRWSLQLWPRRDPLMREKLVLPESIVVSERDQQTLEWLQKATVRDSMASARASECYEHYRRFAVMRGWPVMGLTTFGSSVKKLSKVSPHSFIPERMTRGTIYRGRALDYKPAWARRTVMAEPQYATPRKKIAAISHNGGPAIVLN